MNNKAALSSKAFDASKDQLMTDLKLVLGETNELLKQVVSSSVGEQGSVRATIDSKLSEGKAKLREVRASVVGRVRGTVDASDEYVRDNPWKSLGAVAAGGIMVGLLLSRR